MEGILQKQNTYQALHAATGLIGGFEIPKRTSYIVRKMFEF